MLWKKSWWQTRWLFFICLAALFLLHGLTVGVSDYDASASESLQRNASLSEGERQILSNYQGRIWSLWFRLLFNFIWADFAVILGAFCLMTVSPRVPFYGAGLFTFSLPVSRRKVLLQQAAVGFSEMFLIALIPSLFLPIIARFHGQWFSWSDILVYVLLTIFGGAVLFFGAFLLTVILNNWFIAFVLLETVVIALFLPFIQSEKRPWWNILGVMAGESYFYHGQIPWLGLLISLILSAAFVFTAVRIYEQRDL
jgi:hypothetical protein